jgi:hypothetical protein
MRQVAVAAGELGEELAVRVDEARVGGGEITLGEQTGRQALSSARGRAVAGRAQLVVSGTP